MRFTVVKLEGRWAIRDNEVRALAVMQGAAAKNLFKKEAAMLSACMNAQDTDQRPKQSNELFVDFKQ